MLIDLEQGSDSWKKWRMGGLGGSDSTSVMGESPWRSAFRLWQEKTWRVEGFAGNAASRRGQELEDEARLYYNIMMDSSMTPVCLQHDEHDFARCSMDGINTDHTKGLEIKCSGEKVHNAVANSHEIPKYYYAQCQKAMLCCSTLKSVDYLSYNPDSKQTGVIVNVPRDDIYIERLLNAETEFWWFVQNDTPPPGAPEDYILIEGQEFDLAMEDYLRSKLVLANAKKNEKACKDALLDLTDGENCMGRGGKITRCVRIGAVDYEKLCQDQGISDSVLDTYRKQESTYFKITEAKD